MMTSILTDDITKYTFMTTSTLINDITELTLMTLTLIGDITEWLFVTSYSENLYYAFEFRGGIHNISGRRLTIVIRKANLKSFNYC